LLLGLGWELWARAKDVVYVSRAVNDGWVQCPACGQEARRRRRDGPEGHGRKEETATCSSCRSSYTWREVKDSLRHARPLCLSCGSDLRWTYNTSTLTCPECEVDMHARAYRQSLKGRKILPCPHCTTPIRQPEKRAGGSWVGSPEEARCEACGATHVWRDVKAHWRAEATCGCGAQFERSEDGLTCRECRRVVTRTKLNERLRRRRRGPCPACGETMSRAADTVRCGTCEWEGPWDSLKATWQGETLTTGAGVPACERFIEAWPTARDAPRQMMLVDGFLHALHNGPLAPLFVQGSRDSVAALLDEIGGIKRGPRVG
jgi:transposase-like protein